VITKLQWSHGTTELCSKLYKTKKEQQIFLDFRNFKTSIEGNSRQGKIFLDFLNTKPKLEGKANQY
jgi:DNA primase